MMIRKRPLCYDEHMAIPVHKKSKRKMGRPRKARGQEVSVAMRLSPKFLKAVDEFAHAAQLTRSRALQQLVEIMLSGNGAGSSGHHDAAWHQRHPVRAKRSQD